ncbi:MAG: AmmeMemoRadiSam system protein A [Candidatus Omnitrophica bacterium]|nr:AmmeMemoRadiSam system protein A [Candidatus Omnitrophota bacterium]
MGPREGSDEVISRGGKKRLLEIARATLKEVLSGGERPEFNIDETELKQKLGAFVTLREHGALRGCIGQFVSDKPLYETAQDMALAAALEDPRFPQVIARELNDIDIEISVLSPMKRVGSADEISLGRHGVYIKKGFRGGTFLPQVADETGWTKEEFLGHLARDKAGLGWDGWKDAELYVYTADVFGDKK